MKMKILFLAPRYHSNQTGLVGKLLAEGHEVSFIVMGSLTSEDHSLIRPFVIGPSPFGRLCNRFLNPDNDFARMTSVAAPRLGPLYRGLRHACPDVAVLRGFFQPYILFALPYLLLRRCRIVIYTQGPKLRPHLSWKLRIYSFLALNILRFRWFTTVHHRGSPESQIDVHPEIRFIPFFQPIANGAGHRPYNIKRPRLLAIGKLIERKNLLMLIEALADLGGDCSMELTWIGQCTTAEHRECLGRAEKRRKELGLQDRVRILVNLPWCDVQQQYREHDIFVMPSTREPASVSHVEAMANGLPVICSADNGTAHYVQHERNGFVIQPTRDELCAALRRYVECPNLIPQHGRRSAEIMESDLSIEMAYRDLCELMQ
jgi:glycosyltransferase involved in cell wall biosynthesis